MPGTQPKIKTRVDIDNKSYKCIVYGPINECKRFIDFLCHDPAALELIKNSQEEALTQKYLGDNVDIKGPIKIKQRTIGYEFHLSPSFTNELTDEELFQIFDKLAGPDSQKIYIGPRATFSENTKSFPILDILPAMITGEKQGKNLLVKDHHSFVVLGDSGIGKTSLAKWLYSHFRSSYADYHRIPIYINLPDIYSKNNADNLLQHYLYTLNIPESQITKICSKPLLLILDTFEAVSPPVNLYKLNHWSNQDIRMVTFCRLEAIRDKSKGVLFEVPNLGYQKIYLQPFGRQEIQNYINAYVPTLSNKTKSADSAWSDDPNIYIQTLDKLPEVRQLASIPFMLKKIVSLLPNNDSKTIYITQKKIFESIIDDWFNSQAEHLIKRSELIEIKQEDLSRLLKAYAQNLAATLLGSDGRINNRTLDENDTLKLELVEPIHDEELFKAYHEAPKLYKQCFQTTNAYGETVINRKNLKALRSGCLLKIQNKKFRFLHTLIIEYLAAKNLSLNLQWEFDAYIRETGIEQWNTGLYRQLLRDPGVIQNLVNIASEKEDFKALLGDIILSSKNVPGLQYAAANAITILNKAGIQFSNQDLRDVQIAGADMSYSICIDTDFRGANLKHVKWHQANLEGARWQGANLKDIELLERSFLQASCSINVIASYKDKWLVGSDDGYIYEHSVLDGTQSHTYDYRSPNETNNAVKCIALYEEKMAGAGENKLIKIWSLEEEKNLLYQLSGHTNTINSIVFLSTNTDLTLASGSSDTNLFFWHLPNHGISTRTDTLQPEHFYQEVGVTINSLSFSIQHNLLVAASDKRILAWELPRKNPKIIANAKCISTVFSPYGNWLAFAVFNDLYLLRIPTFEVQYIFKGHTAPINCLAFSPSEDWLVSGSSDSSVRIWSFLTSGECHTVLQNHTKSIQCLTFSSEEDWLMTADADNTLFRWCLPFDSFHAIVGHHDKINSITFCNVNNWLGLITGSNDHTIRLWQLSTGKCTTIYRGHSSIVTCITFSTQSKILASGSMDTTVRLWDFGSGDSLHTFQHKQGISCIAFSKQDLLASGSLDAIVTLYNIETKIQYELPKKHLNSITNVAFSASDQNILVSCSSDALLVWDTTTHQSLQNLNQYSFSCSNIVFTTDDLLICGLNNHNLLAWNMSARNGDFLARKHHSEITAIALGPNGWIATCCKDNIYLWQKLKSGAEYYHYKLIDYNLSAQKNIHVTSIALSSIDGFFLAYGTDNKAFHIWVLNPAPKLNIWAQDPAQELHHGSFPSNISQIAFGSSKPATLAVTGTNGDLGLYQVIDKKIYPLWFHGGKNKLNLQNLNIGQSFGLPKNNQHLFSQAKENIIQKNQEYIPWHALFRPWTNTISVNLEPSSFLDKAILISATIWSVAVVQKRVKKNSTSKFDDSFKDKQPTFLIIEGIKEHRHFVIHAELDTQIYTGHTINIQPIDGLNHFQELTSDCISQVWNISKKNCIQLLHNLREQQQIISPNNIKNSGNHQISWCVSHLKKIGINIPEMLNKLSSDSEICRLDHINCCLSQHKASFFTRKNRKIQRKSLINPNFILTNNIGCIFFLRHQGIDHEQIWCERLIFSESNFRYQAFCFKSVHSKGQHYEGIISNLDDEQSPIENMEIFFQKFKSIEHYEVQGFEIKSNEIENFIQKIENDLSINSLRQLFRQTLGSRTEDLPWIGFNTPNDHGSLQLQH